MDNEKTILEVNINVKSDEEQGLSSVNAIQPEPAKPQEGVTPTVQQDEGVSQSLFSQPTGNAPQTTGFSKENVEKVLSLLRTVYQRPIGNAPLETQAVTKSVQTSDEAIESTIEAIRNFANNLERLSFELDSLRNAAEGAIKPKQALAKPSQVHPSDRQSSTSDKDALKPILGKDVLEPLDISAVLTRTHRKADSLVEERLGPEGAEPSKVKPSLPPSQGSTSPRWKPISRILRTVRKTGRILTSPISRTTIKKAAAIARRGFRATGGAVKTKVSPITTNLSRGFQNVASQLGQAIGQAVVKAIQSGLGQARAPLTSQAPLVRTLAPISRAATRGSRIGRTAFRTAGSAATRGSRIGRTAFRTAGSAATRGSRIGRTAATAVRSVAPKIKSAGAATIKAGSAAFSSAMKALVSSAAVGAISLVGLGAVATLATAGIKLLLEHGISKFTVALLNSIPVLGRFTSVALGVVSATEKWINELSRYSPDLRVMQNIREINKTFAVQQALDREGPFGGLTARQYMAQNMEAAMKLDQAMINLEMAFYRAMNRIFGEQGVMGWVEFVSGVLELVGRGIEWIAEVIGNVLATVKKIYNALARYIPGLKYISEAVDKGIDALKKLADKQEQNVQAVTNLAAILWGAQMKKQDEKGADKKEEEEEEDVEKEEKVSFLGNPSLMYGSVAFTPYLSGRWSSNLHPIIV